MIIKDKLKKVLQDISAARIAVVGDFCLDAYWFVDESMSEISVETGQATRPVSKQRYSLGGAGNVTSNLAAFPIRTSACCQNSFSISYTPPACGPSTKTPPNSLSIPLLERLIKAGADIIIPDFSQYLVSSG